MGVQIDHLRDLDTFRPANFFSFFTIQSNLFVVAILSYSGTRLLLGANWPRLDRLRTAATLYIAITFVVYGLLLSGYRDELNTSVIWVDNVVHKIIPLAMIADWLLEPPRVHLIWRDGRKWLAYPLLYLVDTLIRGPIVDWYPYPFLNPDQAHGYLGILGYSIAIAAGVSVAIAAILWFSRIRMAGHRVSAARRPELSSGVDEDIAVIVHP